MAHHCVNPNGTDPKGSSPNCGRSSLDRSSAQAAGLRYDEPSAQRLLLRATKECRDRLAADGADLSAYNTTWNAADFAGLLTALGIRRWNVYAYSYGTDLANSRRDEQALWLLTRDAELQVRD